MICTSIQNKSLDQIFEILDNCKMAEIRLDSCELLDSEVEECFSADMPLVATCRLDVLAGKYPGLSQIQLANLAEKKLKLAIEAGASYVDLELEMPKEMVKRIKECAHENGSILIRSFHDFKGTDSFEALKAVVEKCFYHGADLVKVATMAKNADDVATVMNLYSEYKEGSLLAFCMGEYGKNSRIDCLKYGAPFTYAAVSEDDLTAPGQWLYEQMQEAVYADKCSFDASLLIPTSKSYAQRAIIAAALADGVSHLRNFTECEDTMSAIAVARALGAEVKIEEIGEVKTVVIKGISASLGSLKGKISEIFVGESGLLTRLMIPIMAQLSGDVVFTGEKTLANRKLAGATEIMNAMGVQLSALEREDFLPLRVEGSLSQTNAEISGVNGSQLVSGLLMAMPFSQKNMNLLVENPKSIPYTFMTIDVLEKFGIKLSNEMLGGRDFLESNGDWSLATEMIFKVKANQKYKATDMDLEGDWSSAAPFLIAGAIFGQASIEGLSTTSLQADLSIMDFLMQAGASLTQFDGDDGEVCVHQSPLLAFTVDASHCPDLFPVLSILAAFSQGESRINGVGRLVNKESNRAEAIVNMLSAMGVKNEITGDELVIEGHSLAWRILNGKLLKGGKYKSHKDHRMVMALSIAALGADSTIEIDDTACVAKSYPNFCKDFNSSIL